MKPGEVAGFGAPNSPGLFKVIRHLLATLGRNSEERNLFGVEPLDYLWECCRAARAIRRWYGSNQPLKEEACAQ